MKKTYQVPEINVVMVAQNLMQTASGAQGTAIKSGNASSSYDVLSRGGNWDDED